MDMSDDTKDVPVSSTDELAEAGGKAENRQRKFGEYRPTNAPLSAAGLRKKPGGEWIPTTSENIGDLEPVPEKDPGKR